MDSLRSLGETLIACIPDIMGEWAGIAHEEPWPSLTIPERVNGLPAVVQGVLNTALCHPANLAARHAKVVAAIQHGERRREHHFEPMTLLLEYKLLREAIRQYVARVVEPALVVPCMLRIDHVMTRASNASLRGYYHREYELRGTWSDVIPEIEREYEVSRPRPGCNTTVT